MSARPYVFSRTMAWPRAMAIDTLGTSPSRNVSAATASTHFSKSELGDAAGGLEHAAAKATRTTHQVYRDTRGDYTDFSSVIAADLFAAQNEL